MTDLFIVDECILSEMNFADTLRQQTEFEIRLKELDDDLGTIIKVIPVNKPYYRQFDKNKW